MSKGRGRARTRFDGPFEDVLVAAQANAPWAFTRLYDWLAPAVAGYLRAQGAADADDLTSDVFLRVFANLRSFAGDESRFRSWVFTIAHNRLLDDRRRQQRRPRFGVPAEEVLADRAGGDVESDALATIASARVQALLERLAPDQRSVLLLRILADLTIDDIAEAVGKRPGAVKALQRRGLEALRRMLDREGVPL